jgi:HSP20 family protein
MTTELLERAAALFTERPNVNLYENEKEVVLEMELPGVSKENVSLEIKDDMLIIAARPRDPQVPQGYEVVYQERSLNAFERSFRLGQELLRDKIQARFENGLLIVSLSKAEKAQPKKIEIA